LQKCVALPELSVLVLDIHQRIGVLLTTMKRIDVRLPDDMYERLQKLATVENRSVRNYTYQIVAGHIYQSESRRAVLDPGQYPRAEERIVS
jgi:predicted transcriptional regulator